MTGFIGFITLIGAVLDIRQYADNACRLQRENNERDISLVVVLYG